MPGSYGSHVASFIGQEYPPAGKARYRAGGRLLPFPYKFQQPRIPALGFGPGWLDGGDLQGKENNPALGMSLPSNCGDRRMLARARGPAVLSH